MKYGARRNKYEKDSKKEYVRTILSPVFDSSSSSPHCVTELSKRLYRRLKNNIIMLNGPRLDNEDKLIKYTKVIYGSNVKFRKVNGEKIIDVARMRHRYVIIATPKKELLDYYKDEIYVVNTDIEDKLINGIDVDNHLSGIILLAFAIEKETKNENVLRSKIIWGRLVREMASYS